MIIYRLLPVAAFLLTPSIALSQPKPQAQPKLRQCLPNERSTVAKPCVPRGVPVIDWCKVGQVSVPTNPCRNGSLINNINRKR